MFASLHYPLVEYYSIEWVSGPEPSGSPKLEDRGRGKGGEGRNGREGRQRGRGTGKARRKGDGRRELLASLSNCKFMDF